MRLATITAALAATLALLAGACTPPPAQTPAPDTVPPATQPPKTTTTTTPPTFRAPTGVLSIGGCDIFGPDHYMNATGIDRLPVHPSSAKWAAFLSRDGQKLHPPSGSVSDGARGGMPINVVDSRTTAMKNVIVDHTYSSGNWTGGYPIPENPRLEGYPSAQWDRHLLIVDVADCTAYELIQYDPLLGSFGIHRALAGTRYPLSGTGQLKKTTNAANTPMIGQYAMFDEVAAGRITHPIGFCTTQLNSAAVWPATKGDGLLNDADAPPMGAWFRLKANVDPKNFTGQARVFVEALRRHGMILTDTCGHQLRLFTENSDGWSKSDMAQLGALTGQHFEAVDPAPMRMSPTSWQIR